MWCCGGMVMWHTPTAPHKQQQQQQWSTQAPERARACNKWGLGAPVVSPIAHTLADCVSFGVCRGLFPGGRGRRVVGKHAGRHTRCVCV